MKASELQPGMKVWLRFDGGNQVPVEVLKVASSGGKAQVRQLDDGKLKIVFVGRLRLTNAF